MVTNTASSNHPHSVAKIVNQIFVALGRRIFGRLIHFSKRFPHLPPSISHQSIFGGSLPDSLEGFTSYCSRSSCGEEEKNKSKYI